MTVGATIGNMKLPRRMKAVLGIERLKEKV